MRKKDSRQDKKAQSRIRVQFKGFQSARRGRASDRDTDNQGRQGEIKSRAYEEEGATGDPGTSPAESPFRDLLVMVSLLGLRLTRRVCRGTTLIATPRTPHPHLSLELSPDPELGKFPMSCGFDTLPLIITDSRNGVS